MENTFVKLKDYINNSILEHPTLYRKSDYTSSKIPILGNLFLTIGTGIEWHKDGFLAYYDNDYKIVKNKSLPKNFFNIELWETFPDKKELKNIKKDLNGHFFYVIPQKTYNSLTVVFEGNYNFAKKITKKYDTKMSVSDTFNIERKPREAKRTELKNESRPYIPYPICNLSALVEMIDKKTTSYHVENFELNNIKKDWIKGALEIAEYTLDFYKDPNKNINSSYHPLKCINSTKYEFEKDPQKYRDARKEMGNMAIEEWIEFCWQNFLKEQIGYCEKLIEMYK